MSTTALVIEFFMIGIQASIWLFFLVCCVFNVDIQSLEWAAVFSPATIVLLAPFCYPLGLFVDDIADLVLHAWKQKIKNKIKLKESINGFKLLCLSKDEWLRQYFGYSRIKVRVSRSSAFNFFIIALLFPLLLHLRFSELLGDELLLAAVFGFVIPFAISIMALATWRSVTVNYYTRLNQAFDAYRLSDKDQ